MPRPILRMPQQSKTEMKNILSATNTQEKEQEQTKINQMKLDRILRKKRSKEYMDAIQKLDAGGHVHNQDKVNDIINAITKEFPEVEMDLQGIMLGIVSICYLGDPYEVHSLDMTGRIIEHFKTGQALPNGMEKARTIAMRGGYAFIEVYENCCRAVSSNGTVSVILC